MLLSKVHKPFFVWFIIDMALHKLWIARRKKKVSARLFMHYRLVKTHDRVHFLRTLLQLSHTTQYTCLLVHAHNRRLRWDA